MDGCGWIVIVFWVWLCVCDCCCVLLVGMGCYFEIWDFDDLFDFGLGDFVQFVICYFNVVKKEDV